MSLGLPLPFWQSGTASPTVLDVAVVPLHNPRRVVVSASELQIYATRRKHIHMRLGVWGRGVWGLQAKLNGGYTDGTYVCFEHFEPVRLQVDSSKPGWRATIPNLRRRSKNLKEAQKP